MRSFLSKARTHLLTTRRLQRENAEDGAVLVLWAVALVGLMGLVAMAVDLGNIAQTKQHTVNAVEDAALAAAPFLRTTESAAATVATDYMLKNYTTLTASDLNTCSASVFQAGITPDPLESCIGFFTSSGSSPAGLSPNGVAVAMPEQAVNYTFGRASGLSSQPVSSIAYATVQTASTGLLLPFATADTAGAGLNCLLDFSHGKVKACNGVTTGSGDRGETNNPRYTVITQVNGKLTYSLNRSDFAPINVDLGLDHPLVAYKSGGEICDWPPGDPVCTGGTNSTAPYSNGDAVRVEAGNDDVTQPLFTGIPSFTSESGSCSLQPRFNHVDGFVASPAACTATAATPSGPYLDPSQYSFCKSGCPLLNGRHISYYLDPASATYTACSPFFPSDNGASAPAKDAVDKGGIPTLTSDTNVWMTPPTGLPQSFDECLSNGINVLAKSCEFTSITCLDPIFTGSLSGTDKDIEASPRFGLVPIVCVPKTPGCANSYPTIEYFAGVYLDLSFPNTKGSTNSMQAWLFPLSLIEGSSTSGSGVGGYYGGDYVTNLCAYNYNC